ncbi:hypothetical protein KQX62_11975 [Rhodopseudomonas palustris]|uniref:Uncharacterized protein n=1 Tax=Rhodopseudomonas palustris TaxID=1076 RepID=A0AAX3E565_RHOPL|nr:hypothetical protein [Rhodopseudomonas palustris]UYO41959.1 hypothetical protein KQX62_11975 [Rhodopseudomonas palustris]
MSVEGQGQQLVARIKKSSKYSYQSPPGEWFEVSVDRHKDFRGNSNCYRACDLAFAVRLDDGTVIELTPL